MPEVLDVAKFQLDAVKAFAQMQNERLKAISDFNTAMVEVAGKQIENAIRIVVLEEKRARLSFLRGVMAEYKNALREVKRKRRKTENQAQRLDKAIKDLDRLRWGQSTLPDNVNIGWRGFKLLINESDDAAKDKIFAKAARPTHRKGQHFSRNRFPNTQCEDAPENETPSAIDLFEWARKKAYVPRRASPPYKLLFQLVNIVNQHAETLLQEFEEELGDIQEELLELRKLGWKKIDLSEVEAKEVEA